MVALNNELDKFFGKEDNYIKDKVRGILLKRINDGDLPIEIFLKKPNTIINEAIVSTTVVMDENANKNMVLGNTLFVNENGVYKRYEQLATSASTGSTTKIDESVLNTIRQEIEKINSTLKYKANIYFTENPPDVKEFCFWIDPSDMSVNKATFDEDGKVTFVEM